MGRGARNASAGPFTLLKGVGVVAKLQQSPGLSPDARGLEGDEKPP